MLSASMSSATIGLLERVRAQSPVIHHLTNWVTIYDCAQIVKTLGAAPVMAHAPEEVAEMSGLASALVLNIGTLDFVEAMKIAAGSANQKGIPVVLDLCGAGATSLRDRKSLELLDSVRIDIIKGNASEVARISGAAVRTRGVDAAEVSDDLSRIGSELARVRKSTVVITGKQDIVTDGSRTWLVKNGRVLLTHVVGTGCMAASVIGAFAAVERDLLVAAASGLACYEIAAELAAELATGPASFKQQLFDCLYALDGAAIDRLERIERIA
jgi:hydroxyethylthiazole kinase